MPDSKTLDRPEFASAQDMLRALKPRQPVYCIHPDVYRAAAAEFVGGFPGRVLYAVKANDDPEVLRLLNEGGIRHFDCASLPEIEAVRTHCPGSTPYFMTPVRLRGAAGLAQREWGVRHFMVDDTSGLERLRAEIDMRSSVVFVRMAVRHPHALQNFANKFGADPDEVPGLLQSVRGLGAEPALAFNVGSSVISPDAYTEAMDIAAGVLRQAGFPLRLVDIGGGFPLEYPGFPVPPLGDYFQAVTDAMPSLGLARDGELMAEPGRRLAAPGLSAVVEVLLRKDDRVYINDGMYGIFWELRFKAHQRYAVTAYREGRELTGDTDAFHLFGPTCDGSDVLPETISLPREVAPGDHLHFHRLGAYSLSGRTRFNAHYSDLVVRLMSH